MAVLGCVPAQTSSPERVGTRDGNWGLVTCQKPTSICRNLAEPATSKVRNLNIKKWRALQWQHPCCASSSCHVCGCHSGSQPRHPCQRWRPSRGANSPARRPRSQLSTKSEGYVALSNLARPNRSGRVLTRNTTGMPRCTTGTEAHQSCAPRCYGPRA